MTTALIVIDVQQEYFAGGLPIAFPPRASSLELIGRAMDHATAAAVPVVVVRHTGQPGGGLFEADGETWALLPDVAERPYDLLVDKRLPGSFTGTPLEAFLAERGVDHVTIAGYMTNVCCDTTARQALHLGLGATMLHDAVGVPAMPAIDGGAIDPEQLQRGALAPLALMGVTMSSTEDWVAAGAR